ncbi:MAG: inositol monophosphatase, partial [Gammaproteobacteria bacterium]|nr:inositol monophosphatase [Gammaproteobacteria bacterium]
MHPLVNIAVTAARRAGKTIMRKSYRVDQLKFSLKEARDFVSSVDVEAEQEIVETILEAYPN